MFKAYSEIYGAPRKIVEEVPKAWGPEVEAAATKQKDIYGSRCGRGPKYISSVSFLFGP